jgi:hypothetical protein
MLRYTQSEVKIMPKLKEILDKKGLIEEYCQAFDFSNPRLLFMIGEDSFNIVVDNNNSEAYNDVLLETLLENQLDCSCAVTISDELVDYLKKEKQNLTATLDETSKIESLYGKKLHEISIGDRQKDPITLARDEDIKKQIVAVFEKKGLASPYESVEMKKSTLDLTTNQDFIEGGSQIDSVAEQQAVPIILLIKSKLDKIIDDKEEQEKTAYAIIKELEGLRGLEIPQVKYTDSTYNIIVDAVANMYTTDQQYVNRIKTIVGVKVYPNDAKVLRTYFPNFPNIFNNEKIEIKPAQSTDRSNSPSLGGWF